MNNKYSLTPLEVRLLDAIRQRYATKGFPAAEDMRALSRVNTGAGRTTRLSHGEEFDSPDGELFGGQFDMPGLEFGATFFVGVEGGKIKSLEILVNGNGVWNGDEREPIQLYLV